ncbi:single-stranded-DNA-specific exonuclease RecJ [Parafilimonas terrae]|uniref:Single-stranded-DNA-specific exonuclease RecJ n=1 Tax=Parafilimonas terrae TaxID=1465490 RepID=A0A1I5RG36_9BACT|nr:single-stranded-DNA-specific exonuclease RecJ [Parafilimonas terrae]SFP57508.1 exonuclease RecJ [Parafilimonas terrae]
MQKRWNILPFDETATLQLQQALRINRTICKILVQRGIDTYNKAHDFFRPALSQLHDPWLMKDMLKAVTRIIAAINNKEKILVFGDYDVDGTTSVACMYQFLKSIYPQVAYYIPHRYKEGYGISKAGIDFAYENNFSLIIALDCGIKSAELINYAKQLNIDFVICDHHLPDEIIPDAIAVLDPKQKDCNYPYKELCGCGVGFKLMQALSDELGLLPEYYLKYIDLVAVAIAADIVPIDGENRILAFHGLKKVNENPSVSLKALLSLAGMQKKVHINSLVFIVAPRINAAGRMDDAKKAVQLFIEEDYDKAMEYAKLLHNDNTERKEADSNITDEALTLIENDAILKQRKTTVVYKEHWHKGVVGIVASRLIENYYRPTIVLTKSGDIIAGSARSVPGFNLYEAIHACREHLLGYGGHFAAAGLSMMEDKLPGFIDSFEKVVSQTITEELLIPEIIIDAELSFNEINFTFLNIIEQMEPFGPGNMRPVFISRNVKNTGYSKLVKENHVRFVLQQHDKILTGIGFNMAEKFALLESNLPLDVVYTLDINEWNGERMIQMKMIDFRLSA